MKYRLSEEFVDYIAKSKINHVKLFFILQRYIKPEDVIRLMDKDNDLCDNDEFIEWLNNQDYSIDVWLSYSGDNLKVHRCISEKIKKLNILNVDKVIKLRDKSFGIDDINRKIDIIKMYKQYISFDNIYVSQKDLLNEKNKNWYEKKLQLAQMFRERKIYTNEELENISKQITEDELLDLYYMLREYKGENIEFAINLFEDILKDYTVSLSNIDNPYLTGDFILAKAKKYNYTGTLLPFGKSELLDEYILEHVMVDKSPDELFNIKCFGDNAKKRLLDSISIDSLNNFYRYLKLLLEIKDISYIQSKIEIIESKKGIEFILETIKAIYISHEDFYELYFRLIENNDKIIDSVLKHLNINKCFKRYKGKNQKIIKKILENIDFSYAGSFDINVLIDLLNNLEDEDFILNQLKRIDFLSMLDWNESPVINCFDNIVHKDIFARALIEKNGLSLVIDRFSKYKASSQLVKFREIIKYIYNCIPGEIQKEEIMESLLKVVNSITPELVLQILKKYNFDYASIKKLPQVTLDNIEISNFINEHYKEYLLLENYKENDENQIKALINQISDLQNTTSILLHQLGKITDENYILSILKKIDISKNNFYSSDFSKLCNKSDIILNYFIEQYGIDYVLKKYNISTDKDQVNILSIKIILDNIKDISIDEYKYLCLLTQIIDSKYVLNKLKSYTFNRDNIKYCIKDLCNISDDIVNYLINEYSVDFILENYSPNNEERNKEIIKIILDKVNNIENNEEKYINLLSYMDVDYVLNKLKSYTFSQEIIKQYTLSIWSRSDEILNYIIEQYGYEIFKEYKGQNEKLIIYSLIALLGEETYHAYSEEDTIKLYFLHKIIQDNELIKKILDTKNKFKEITNIDIFDFIKYSNSYNVLTEIPKIFLDDQKAELFKKLFLKFNNYFGNDKLLGIPFLTESILFFSVYPALSNDIISRDIEFNPLVQNNILKLLKRKDRLNITSIEELMNLNSNIDKEINDAINNEEISIQELKNIFMKNFVNIDFQSFGNLLSYKISPKTLEKILAKKENMSDEDYQKIYYLDIFITFINEIYALEDKEKIKKALELINTEEKRTNFLEIFNYFSDLDEKIREAYEIDANATLTNLSELPEELFVKDGGYYDLSQSEYGLYTHSTSLEDLPGLVNPRYHGFGHICISGISDRMRKRNYLSNIIVLFDNVPKGNFIGSAPYNLGSNGLITTNSYVTSRIDYIEMEFKDNSSYIMAGKSEHSETNCWRDGMVPSGILVSGDKPTEEEIKAAEILRELTGKPIPLVKVQEIGRSIENPQKIPKKSDYKDRIEKLEDLKEMLEDLKEIVDLKSQSNKGRKIAILTDIHGLDVPLEATLKDIRSKGITEIYSLGDNFGDGPNPRRVMELLEEYGVISVSGNAEDYLTLGTEQFRYIGSERKQNILWTKEQLGKDGIEKIARYPRSIDIMLGGKRIGLCHFASDVRTDSGAVWAYQDSRRAGTSGYLRFTNTNKGKTNDSESLFGGKKVDVYDAIIQGHTHFKIDEKSPNTEFITLRANGMGYESDPINSASYITLEDLGEGYKIEKVLVEFDRSKLAESFVRLEQDGVSFNELEKLKGFTNLTEEELEYARANLGIGGQGGRK